MSNSRIVAIYSVLFGWLTPLAALAQSPASDRAACTSRIDLTSSTLSDARRSLWRALTLTSRPENSGLFRSASIGSSACADGHQFLFGWRPATSDTTGTGSPQVTVLPVEVAARRNSAYPRSVNDGAAWHGVGWNAAGAAGVSARWRFLAARLAPEFSYQQNAEFQFVRNDVVGYSEFATPYQRWIDYPTRFGTEEITTFDLGQSYVQVNAGPAAVTFGKENLWIGAADVHPILLSYTAPGFPHVRIGTQKPLDLKVVRVELQLIFASLKESNYFDLDATNDDHYFTTTMLVVEPSFVRGLFLGFARAYHDTASATGQSLGFYTSRLIETPFGNSAGGNRIGNSLGVLLARWVLPESGFEAYAEWGREDTPGDWKDVLREPDWTQAYVLGVQKAFTRPDRLVRFYGELVHLGESAPSRAGRGFFSYYTHAVVLQGHTNEGQLLGAAIGPGSDAQLLGVDIFMASGRTAFSVERTRYDDDTYYRTFARRWGETRHDAEITLAASHLRFVGPLEIEAGAAYSRRYDRNFVAVAAEAEPLIEDNWQFHLRAAWQPRW